MFIGTTVRDPGIVNFPVSPTTTVDINGQLVPTVKRGQVVKFAGGLAVPVTSAADIVLGFALSDSDQLNLVVPIFISSVTVEMQVATGLIILQGDFLYSNGDGTVTNVQPGTNPSIGRAVNPSYGQTTVEMATH